MHRIQSDDVAYFLRIAKDFYQVWLIVHGGITAYILQSIVNPLWWHGFVCSGLVQDVFFFLNTMHIPVECLFELKEFQKYNDALSVTVSTVPVTAARRHHRPLLPS